MKKLKDLLKKLGFKDEVINKYMESDDEKTKDLDPEKDGSGILAGIKEVLKNDLEPELKQAAQTSARAHIYGEIETFFMKHGNFKKEDLKAEAKWADYANKYVETVKAEAEKTKGGDDKSKATITQLQEDLRLANKAKEEAEAKVTEAQSKAQEEITSFKNGVQKESFLIDTIGKLGKKTKLPAQKVLKLISDQLHEKYAVVNIDGKFDIRDKSDGTKKINKTASEFLGLQDALEEIINAEDLFEKSNAHESPQKTIIDTNEEGKTTKKKVVLPPGAEELAAENEKTFSR